MTKDELLAALLVERYTSPWWVTPTPELAEDDDVTIRRRRATATQEQKAFETSNKTHDPERWPDAIPQHRRRHG